MVFDSQRWLVQQFLMEGAFANLTQEEIIMGFHGVTANKVNRGDFYYGAYLSLSSGVTPVIND